MGTVTLVETGDQFASFQDSRFKLLAYGVEYRARLQRSLKDPMLCHDDVDVILPPDSSPGKNCVWMNLTIMYGLLAVS